MPKVCSNSWCSVTFEIYDEDRDLLEKFDVPEPDICPDCRHQLRGMFTPMLVFHRRTSDLSNKPIISVYDEHCPFPVYAIQEWWSDEWDAMEYGRDFDFSKPFFEQFKELHNSVPKMANANENAENCDYCYSAGNSKNCYYSRTAHRSEDIYYSEFITGANDKLFDCLRCQRTTVSSNCVKCIDCHYSSYLFFCDNTRDSHFCVDCRGCSNCLFCHNIRNQNYCVFNEEVGKEKFEEILSQTIDGKYSTLQENLKKWNEVNAKNIWRNLNNLNCEACQGDGMVNSANCHECYDCFNCENNRYCMRLSPSEKCVSSMDLTRGGIGELLYNSVGIGGGNYFVRMCSQCRQVSDLTYCTDCFTSKNCFGCAGLKSKQYCVFNKQYSEQEYNDLTEKIVKHMNDSGEWGRFFPADLSPFAYNESGGMELSPLTKQEVEQRGWRWIDRKDEPLKVDKVIPAAKLPDSIADIPDDVLNWAIECEQTGRPFKIQPQELEFYKEHNVPMVHLHPDVRMAKKRQLLNPYKLWDRQCKKCSKGVPSTFAPERKEIVYCEECYMAEVY